MDKLIRMVVIWYARALVFFAFTAACLLPPALLVYFIWLMLRGG